MSRKPTAEEDGPELQKIAYTVDEIKVAAYNWKDLPPPDIGLPERCLWLTLANVYKRFRDGELTREDGETLTKEAILTYQKDKAASDAKDRIIRARAEMWERIELAGHRYGTERTLEAADAFFEAVYNVKLKTLQKGGEEE